MSEVLQKQERREHGLSAFLSSRGLSAADQLLAECANYTTSPEITADIATDQLWRWILENEPNIFGGNSLIKACDAKNILWFWFFVGFIQSLTVNSYSLCSKQQLLVPTHR